MRCKIMLFPIFLLPLLTNASPAAPLRHIQRELEKLLTGEENFVSLFSSVNESALHLEAQRDHETALKDPENPNTDPEYRKRNVFKVGCPAIGSLYKIGNLMPDALGRVSNFQITSALNKKLGITLSFSAFQGTGIAGYDYIDINQYRRNRSPVSKRYLNIFRLHPGDFPRSDTVQHGYSTTIHDSRFDPEPTSNGPNTNYGKRDFAHPNYYLEDIMDENFQKAVYSSRETRMKEKYLPLAEWEERNGEKRMYHNGLAKFLGGIKQVGDYSGEWSYHAPNGTVDMKKSNTFYIHTLATKLTFEGHPAPLAMTEWQALGAWSTFWVMLGRVDADRKKKEDRNGDNPLAGLYMTEKDLLRAFLDYEFDAFNERKDWTPLRTVGIKEVQGNLLDFNKIVNGSNTEPCADGSQCTFPWVAALQKRGVVKTGLLAETRTLAAFAQVLEEVGLYADGKN